MRRLVQNAMSLVVLIISYVVVLDVRETQVIHNSVVSMKDDLMVRFGSDRIGEMMKTMGLGDQAIQSKTFTKSIGTAQKRVEGNNFDIRKQLLQYDDVMNDQREIMYAKRNRILDSESIHEMVLDTFRHMEDLVKSHLLQKVP